MIRLKRRRILDATADFTSLMDVVFILLIFFLLTAVTTPMGISVQLPQAESGTRQDAKNSIALTLKPGGKIFLNGKTISLESLAPAIRAFDPGSPVLLAGDRDVSYGFLIQILDQLSQMPDYPLILATETKPQAPTSEPGKAP